MSFPSLETLICSANGLRCSIRDLILANEHHLLLDKNNKIKFPDYTVNGTNQMENNKEFCILYYETLLLADVFACDVCAEYNRFSPNLHAIAEHDFNEVCFPFTLYGWLSDKWELDVEKPNITIGFYQQFPVYVLAFAYYLSKDNEFTISVEDRARVTGSVKNLVKSLF